MKNSMRKKIATLTATAVLALGVGTIFAISRPAPAAGAEMIVYKSSSCGCCKGWVNYLRQNGYRVTVIERDDMEAVKDRLGVPAEMRSCHTAKIDGYLIEGHVTVEAIRKILAERPKLAGIASPGMPSGAPGMDGPRVPNTVYGFSPRGASPLSTY